MANLYKSHWPMGEIRNESLLLTEWRGDMDKIWNGDTLAPQLIYHALKAVGLFPSIYTFSISPPIPKGRHFRYGAHATKVITGQREKTQGG